MFKRFFDRDKRVTEGFENIYLNSKKVLQSIENKDIKLLGKLFKEDFLTRKTMLDSLVPDIGLFDTLDNIPEVYGYRICGAASGGTIVVCVDKEKREKVKNTIREQNYQIFECYPEDIKVSLIDA